MGIDINCCNENCDFEWKQCFVYRRQLLDALRAYLMEDESTYQKELKFVNWLYRDEDESYSNITEEERNIGYEELKKKNLDGMFFYIFLTYESIITYSDAQRFLKTFDKVKSYMDDDFFLDLDIIEHAFDGKGFHNLKCW